jgi:hypothetical protein
MVANEKARVEKENIARHGTKDSKTVLSGPMGGTGRTFEQAHSEWQKSHKFIQSGRGTMPSMRANARDMERLETEMRAMGARRQVGGQGWEMPPKPGTPEHAKELLNRDLQGLHEELHGSPYSPLDILASARMTSGSSSRPERSG